MSKGLTVIAFDSLDQTTIFHEDITWVAFEWNTRKVYWIKSNEKIKTSNLDGTSEELLVFQVRTRISLLDANEVVDWLTV